MPEHTHVPRRATPFFSRCLFASVALRGGQLAKLRQPSLTNFLPTAFDTKFCETVLILAAGGKCKVGLSSVGWAEAELGGHFHFQAARGQTPPADPNFSFLEAKLCLHTFLLISCVHRRLCFLIRFLILCQMRVLFAPKYG